MARWGGEGWVDLSTGINRAPWPMPPLPDATFAELPTDAAMQALIAAARQAYVTEAPIVAFAGAQAAIQLIPRLRAPGRARVIAPTYNEHAAALAAAGWQVEPVETLGALAGADLAVVVNPNNPDGRLWDRAQLLELAARVGLLVVDESFADPDPRESLAAAAGQGGLVVLRSFGKFYGLAGLRLGFALGAAADLARLAAHAGPWAVSGPAIAAGSLALADRAWADGARRALATGAARLDRAAAARGWRLVGGTPLFRTYDTGHAEAAQAALARRQIWSRIFPYSDSWLRLGLPGNAAEWARLEAALAE